MKGLLVTPDLLLAYASGRKTVTRRLSGLKEINLEPDAVKYVGVNLADEFAFEIFLADGTSTLKYIKPPYRVGEMVYLKEAFYVQPDLWEEGHGPQPLHYKADAGRESYEDYILKSPLFMPAWAARHFQRITGVRPERLQEISPEDCYAEGTGTSWAPASNQLATYSKLWDSLYPKYPWASNPWCWVVASQKA